MTDVKTITVWTEKQKQTQMGAVRRSAVLIVFWGCLVGAEAASHLLFGGSWVVDVMVLAFAFIMVADKISKLNGYKFDMTQGEIIRWAADGAPFDVMAWRKSKN